MDSNILWGERVKLPTKYGYFELITFQEKTNGFEHMALIKGNFSSTETILTRIHSACATGDLFGSLRCDCGEQLIESLKLIEKNGNGIILYLQQEGRGIGLMNKMKAYKLQEEGMNTLEANLHLGFAPDERDYEIGAKILNQLGIKKVKLLTNNPDKILGLEKNGIVVMERISLIIKPNPCNKYYLDTKESLMGHQFSEKKLENRNYDY